MSISTTDYLRYTWHMLNGFRVYAERVMDERRCHDVMPYLELRSPLRVLDLANGRLRPQYTLLKAAGHQVCGIDIVNRPSLGAVDLAYVVARRLFTWRL